MNAIMHDAPRKSLGMKYARGPFEIDKTAVRFGTLCPGCGGTVVCAQHAEHVKCSACSFAFEVSFVERVRYVDGFGWRLPWTIGVELRPPTGDALLRAAFWKRLANDAAFRSHVLALATLGGDAWAGIDEDAFARFVREDT